MKVTESVVQAVLMRWAMHKKNHIVVVPNANYITIGEGDLFSVTRAMLLHEYEIKLSRSDYNRDFRNKQHKHQRMSLRISTRIPNYFWFVIHGFDVDLSDVPEYAGLMRLRFEPSKYNEGMIKGLLDIVKVAPRISDRKVSDKTMKKIAHLLSYRVQGAYKKSELERLNVL